MVRIPARLTDTATLSHTFSFIASGEKIQTVYLSAFSSALGSAAPHQEMLGNSPRWEKRQREKTSNSHWCTLGKVVFPNRLSGPTTSRYKWGKLQRVSLSYPSPSYHYAYGEYIRVMAWLKNLIKQKKMRSRLDYKILHGDATIRTASLASTATPPPCGNIYY